MKKLILLANEFPYGNWEPYLETEVKYYEGIYDEIMLFSLQLRKEHKKSIRKLPRNFEVYPIDYASKLRYAIYFFVIIFDSNLYKEIIKLVRHGTLNIARILRLMIFLSRSHYEKNKIIKILRGSFKKNDKALLYSYRFEYQPYVAILLKRHFKNFSIISRAHRSDLYEDENRYSYIPMREIILSKIDEVYFISEDGYNYINRLYPEYKYKLNISRLGTLDYGLTDTKLCDTLNIVTCSNIVEVKRIDKLIDCLSEIKDIRIHWTHYGNGVLESEIKEKANLLLKDNISYSFKGHYSNIDLMKQYQTCQFHVFINISSSEGIPVSIMEALSFGIPCIATNVGGTNEIIKEGVNGFMLEKDFTSNDLIESINKVFYLGEVEYKKMRLQSREFWKNHYFAENCYLKFLRNLRDTYE